MVDRGAKQEQEHANCSASTLAVKEVRRKPRRSAVQCWK